jgi:pimeloyl-[acyl-carrier protein] synthase
VVERLRQRIQELVDTLLDRVARAGTMDVMADLAYPLPVLVIADMLRIPREDCDQLKAWSFELNASFDPMLPLGMFERLNEVVRNMNEYFSSLVTARRRQPDDDLLTALIDARDQGDRLNDKELLATCIFLFWAGHETTVNLLGNGVLTLLRHPSELERLRDTPSLVPGAVEEMLRFESPVQLAYRMALMDLDLGGRSIRRGQQVVLAIGAANRDPAQFRDPERFDIARSDVHHVAFGHGIHYCLGAALARAQGQIAIGELLRRCKGLRLSTATLEWNDNILLRGLKALPVTFEATHQRAT